LRERVAWRLDTLAVAVWLSGHGGSDEQETSVKENEAKANSKKKEKNDNLIMELEAMRHGDLCTNITLVIIIPLAQASRIYARNVNEPVLWYNMS
jgi:hypothetical protein